MQVIMEYSYTNMGGWWWRIWTMWKDYDLKLLYFGSGPEVSLVWKKKPHFNSYNIRKLSSSVDFCNRLFLRYVINTDIFRKKLTIGMLFIRKNSFNEICQWLGEEVKSMTNFDKTISIEPMVEDKMGCIYSSLLC